MSEGETVEARELLSLLRLQVMFVATEESYQCREQQIESAVELLGV